MNVINESRRPGARYAAMVDYLGIAAALMAFGALADGWDGGWPVGALFVLCGAGFAISIWLIQK